MLKEMKMDFNSRPDTYKKGSDGVSDKYLYDVEKELYNIATNYMPHLKQSSMEDEIKKITNNN
jgi:hypothetical protein